MPQFLQTLSNFRCGTVRNVHGCSWIERYFAFQIASRMSSGEAWRNHSVLIAFASPSCLFYTMCQWIMTLDRNVTRWPTVTESVHCRCSWTRFRISRANLAFLVARYDSSNCHLKINAFLLFHVFLSPTRLSHCRCARLWPQGSWLKIHQSLFLRNVCETSGNSSCSASSKSKLFYNAFVLTNWQSLWSFCEILDRIILPE